MRKGWERGRGEEGMGEREGWERDRVRGEKV